jgi:hypothetical protein
MYIVLDMMFFSFRVAMAKLRAVFFFYVHVVRLF